MTLPAWLTEEDVAFYASELSRSGFRGGVNWCRNVNAMPGLLAPFAGSAIDQPASYLAGEYDLLAGNTAEALAALPRTVPGLRSVHVLPGAGHWLQQERPTKVNEAPVGFLTSL